MQVNKISFKQHSDKSGSLVALGALREVPFQIKRVYYLYNMEPYAVRGCHAHKTLEQFIVCVNGSCLVKLDNGKEREIISLSKPDDGLYIPELMWREVFEFSPDAVLLVLASDTYDESDYIRDYDEFLRWSK